MRTRVAALIAAALPLAACAASTAGTKAAAGKTTASGTTAASCVSPRLTVTPQLAQPGQTARLSGDWFSADCFDVVIAGQQPRVASPLKGLVITVTQRDHSWTVATGVNATGARNSIDTQVRIPADLRPGPAVVQVKDYGTPTTFRVAAAP